MPRRVLTNPYLCFIITIVVLSYVNLQPRKGYMHMDTPAQVIRRHRMSAGVKGIRTKIYPGNTPTERPAYIQAKIHQQSKTHEDRGRHENNQKR